MAIKTITSKPKLTAVQELPGLVEWYISDNQIELRFDRHDTNKGLLAPEFNFVYLMGGRRITERCLAMLIMTELGRRGYSYQLSKVIACLTEFSWRFYMSNQDYPEWLATDKPLVRKKPGRPRTRPQKLEYEPTVNTSSQENDDV